MENTSLMYVRRKEITDLVSESIDKTESLSDMFNNAYKSLKTLEKEKYSTAYLH